METKFEQIIAARVEKFAARVAESVFAESVPLVARYRRVERGTTWSERLDGELASIEEGATWGEAWGSAWFELRGRVPESWRGSRVVAHLDLGGEGLVFDRDGTVLQGITTGSIFDMEFGRDVVPLRESCDGGEDVELWVEAASNGLFGMFKEMDPPADSPRRYGHYDAQARRMRLAIFDADLWHLWLDLSLLGGLVEVLPEKSVRRARLLHVASAAIDAFAENPSNAGAARDVLARELDKGAVPSAPTALAVGHAHIDTAWLWPIAESVRKCARTFASQVDLLGRYPDYVFGASQPQHYAFVKERHPELYDRVRQAVADGRWEPQGGMWVEADCNLIDGESMVRQILHGKNFFRDEFGVDVKNLWLPDVFGYSAALPQILKRSGIDFFLTQKISWNQINDFPHTTFKWRGIDGSEVLTHFPPENNYNSRLDAKFLVPGMENFREKGYLDEFMSLFGVGDGGGGPKAENIEWGRRMADLEGTPRVRFGRADEFFARLADRADELPSWDGELYLELHRGTLTTHARVKRANRHLEARLRHVERLWSCLPLADYPIADLDRAWKKLLLHQFHDILPGSSITEAYRETAADHGEADAICARLEENAAARLFDADENALVVANTAPVAFDGTVELPESWRGRMVRVAGGAELPTQAQGDEWLARVAVESGSFVTLERGEAIAAAPVAANETQIVENDLVRYAFSGAGTLVEAHDKIADRSILPAGEAGNVLTLYADHPNDWDAWDVDFFYEKNVVEAARCVEIETLGSGAVRSGLRLVFETGSSRVEQRVTLDAGSAELRFRTRVDWRECHRMLRVAFPIAVTTPVASFDIQYGFVERPTHRNTSWDRARFEVAAQRWADLSERDWGVALLNDCKYGHKVDGHVLDLNLLRSPTYPDPDADRGEHELTYSLYPHAGDLRASDVIEAAARLNEPPRLFAGRRGDATEPPARLEGDGLSLEVVKRAEKEECLVLRIVERSGRRSRGRLHVADRYAGLVETDLMEWTDGESASCTEPLPVELGPFEIRTYKLRTQAAADTSTVPGSQP